MKKFTTLKEDLLKESEQVEQKFNTHLLDAQTKLEKIKTALTDFEGEYKLDMRNWGYVGSLGHVNELLDRILEFLEYEPFRDDSLGSKLIHGGYQPNKDNTSPIPPDGVN